MSQTEEDAPFPKFEASSNRRLYQLIKFEAISYYKFREICLTNFAKGNYSRVNISFKKSEGNRLADQVKL